jgi:hypothetical protein
LPLKHTYSDGILALARNRIIYIAKEDFLPAFKAAYNKAFIEDNIYTGFRGARLVPLNLDIIILKLNIRLCTLTSPT